MVKKEHRLKKNKQFLYIYKHGDIKHSQFLSIVYSKTKYSPFKVGFSVSKKVGKSVVRSKVKRKLRECFNKLENSFNPGYNYVFIAKDGIAQVDFNTLLQTMQFLLKKAGLFVCENN